ncbi:hypothetical protein [Halorussus pelagicus]|uniref:hypothetical protein n=1 Tax=Halorussus pelagicus TaxID=2505977 RepID=UPI000FFBE0D5|nr:hypothetical protein [Halorussus pelagicus]
MPGTPDPVLGSDALTFAVACAVGALVAAAPYGFRELLPRSRVVAVGGGLAYAVVCLGAWVGARLATDAFVAGMTADPLTALGWVLAGAIILGAQAAIPYYGYARWRLVVPLAALFAVTALILPPFLSVRGESDPLSLYVILFGPLSVAATALVGVTELAVRRFVFSR